MFHLFSSLTPTTAPMTSQSQRWPVRKTRTNTKVVAHQHRASKGVVDNRWKAPSN